MELDQTSDEQANPGPHQPRITSLMTTPREIIVSLSDGNPGAISAMIELWTKTSEIDRDSALGGVGPLLELDALGIYGSRIWLLYNDVANRDVVVTAGLLRAVQLGYLTRSELGRAIDNRQRRHSEPGHPVLDIPGLMSRVRARLPGFQRRS